MNSIIKLYGMANWSIFADRALNSLNLIADTRADRNSDYEALVTSVTEGIEKKIPIDLIDPNDVKIVIKLADLLVEKTARASYLKLCYLLSYFKMPLIYIKHEEREAFLEALGDKYKMRLFLSEKIREAVFFDGNLLEKVGGKFGSERYLGQKEVVIEWHELIKAARKWQLTFNKGQ